MGRTIIHLDMDAFFASVEVRDNPTLKGKPVIIGALPGERGVVSTCSYEARKFGVRSAMSITEAYKRCPNGIYLSPSMHKYAEESEKIHEIMASYTDVIEYVSLDEGYMDVTASLKLFESAEKIAKELKRRIFDEVCLTCSVGVGYSKTSAKLASEEKKPNGFFVIPNKEAFVNLIKNRDIRILPGVGEKTARRLALQGFLKVSDLLWAKESDLNFLGALGKSIFLHARGIDESAVVPNEEAKSVGREYTFQRDITERGEIEDIICFISRRVSYQLKNKNLCGKTVTVKIKFSDMQLITRSKTVEYTNSAKKINAVALKLLEKTEIIKPVRLIGVSVSNMENEECVQMSFSDFLTETESKQDVLDETVYEINKGIGKGSLKTAKEMLAEKNFKSRRKI